MNLKKLYYSALYKWTLLNLKHEKRILKDLTEKEKYYLNKLEGAK